MAAVPTLDDLKVHLGTSADQWSDDVLSEALECEQQAQEDRCTVPTLYPSTLRQAVLRRVSRNLAMRKLPLGISVSDVEATRVTATDPEVRRLEAPYRRRVVG